MQSRFFTDGQRRFIRRYGARLDELAGLVAAPRTEAEQHFVRVCNGEPPIGEKERLWLLVQLVCRYEADSSRAVRVSIAETRSDAHEGEMHGLRVSQHEDAHYIMELIRDLQMATGEKAPVRERLSLCNVEHATLQFAGAMGLHRSDRALLILSLAGIHSCFLGQALRSPSLIRRHERRQNA